MKYVTRSLMLLFSICFFITLTSQNISAAEPLRQGIDCGCTRTGDYVKPAAPRRAVNGRAPAVHLSGSDPLEGQSS